MPLVEIIRGTATSDAVSCLSSLLLPPGQLLCDPGMQQPAIGDHATRASSGEAQEGFGVAGV